MVYTAIQSQKAINAYFSSKQLPLPVYNDKGTIFHMVSCKIQENSGEKSFLFTNQRLSIVLNQKPS